MVTGHLHRRMYVIVVNKTTAARVINVYRSNGKFERALKPHGRRPFRIAVDYKETIVFVYDAEQQQIDSLDVRSGETVITIHNVSYVQHLYFWESNLVWSGLRQQGFFSAAPNGWTVKQVRSAFLTSCFFFFLSFMFFFFFS